MSEPHREPSYDRVELRDEVARLVQQSRRYQEDMVRIQDELQRLKIRLATLSNSESERDTGGSRKP